MGNMTPQEQTAYKLMVKQGMNSAEASRELKKQGYDITPERLIDFKRTLVDQKSREVILEFGMENILDSYEKLKIEASEAFHKVKDLATRLESTENFSEYLAALKEQREYFALGLKQMGKLEHRAAQIQAKNLNVLNVSDINKSFKTVVTSWFSEMNAEVKDGKLIFNNPSPELMDDFFKWESKQLNTAVKVDVDGTGD